MNSLLQGRVSYSLCQSPRTEVARDDWNLDRTSPVQGVRAELESALFVLPHPTNRQRQTRSPESRLEVTPICKTSITAWKPIADSWPATQPPMQSNLACILVHAKHKGYTRSASALHSSKIQTQYLLATMYQHGIADTAMAWSSPQRVPRHF